MTLILPISTVPGTRVGGTSIEVTQSYKHSINRPYILQADLTIYINKQCIDKA